MISIYEMSLEITVLKFQLHLQGDQWINVDPYHPLHDLIFLTVLLPSGSESGEPSIKKKHDLLESSDSEGEDVDDILGGKKKQQKSSFEQRQERVSISWRCYTRTPHNPLPDGPGK